MAKYLTIAFLGNILLIASCTRDTDIYLDNADYHFTPNNIKFVDFEPDIHVNSVDSFDFNFIPIPSEAEEIFEFDGDGDSVNDYYLHNSHWFDGWVSVSNPGNNYGYSVRLIGIGDSNLIALPDTDSYMPVKYENGMKIPQRMIWGKASTLYYSSPANQISFGYINKSYIPIKILRGSKTFYGWIYMPNLATLDALAINLTNGNSIYTGQTE